MVKKIILEYTQEFDYLLFAIVSFEKDYKLIWDINTNLGIDFLRMEDYSVFSRRTGKEQLFSCFNFKDENSYMNYKLLSNKSENGLLLDELKGIDYLLLISGEYPEDFVNDFMSRLNNISSIQNVFNIDPSELKSKEKLVID